MEGWVSPGPGCKEQLAHVAHSQRDLNPRPRGRWSNTLTIRRRITQLDYHVCVCVCLRTYLFNIWHSNSLLRNVWRGFLLCTLSQRRLNRAVLLDSLARRCFHIASVSIGDKMCLHAQSVGERCQLWTNTDHLSLESAADKVYCIKVMTVVHQLCVTFC